MLTTPFLGFEYDKAASLLGERKCEVKLVCVDCSSFHRDWVSELKNCHVQLIYNLNLSEVTQNHVSIIPMRKRKRESQ